MQLTKLDAQKPEHQDLTNTTKRRDADDLKKMETFLRERNPFQQSAKGLVSLSTDIIASDAVDCDQALKKGEATQAIKLEGATLSELK